MFFFNFCFFVQRQNCLVFWLKLFELMLWFQAIEPQSSILYEFIVTSPLHFFGGVLFYLDLL